MYLICDTLSTNHDYDYHRSLANTSLAMTEVNNSQLHGTVFVSTMWCLQSQTNYSLSTEDVNVDKSENIN